MNVPESIIIYRNPAEKMLWESGMLWPIIVACALLFVSILLSAKVMNALRPRFSRWKYYRTLEGNLPLYIGGAVFIGTLWYML